MAQVNLQCMNDVQPFLPLFKYTWGILKIHNFSYIFPGMKSNHAFFKHKAFYQIPAQRMLIMRAEASHNSLHDSIMRHAMHCKQDVPAQVTPSVSAFCIHVQKRVRKKQCFLKKPCTLEPDTVGKAPIWTCQSSSGAHTAWLNAPPQFGKD